MGFRVNIGPNASAISKRLKGSPYTIFREPFAGYLLFLFDHVSGDDVAFKNWFEKHVEPLHLMTGGEIAFAVFAHDVDIRVHVPTCKRDRAPEVRPVPLEDKDRDFSIESLVYSGRCGHVVDGDKIRAINAAVYDLAREFGVLQMLPCIIALDGLPDPRIPWKCFPTSQYDLRGLFGRLRSAVGRLQIVPSLPAYRSGLKAIQDKTEQWQKLQVMVKECKGELNRRREEPPFPRWISEVQIALRRGDKVQLFHGLQRLSKYHPCKSFAEDYTTKYYSTSAVLASAVREVSRILKLPWPLEEGDKETLSDVFRTRVRGLLGPENQGLSFESRDEVLAMLHDLNRVRAAYIAEAMQELPSLTRWMERAKDRWYSPVAERLRSCELRLAKTDLDIHNAARAILAMHDRPSWCRILEDEFDQGRSTATTHQSSQPNRADISERLLDWATLPESLSLLRRMDFLRLLRSFRQLISEFGQAIWTRNPTAFASYATCDRPEVLRRVQGMRAFQPNLDIFLDFHSLCPGEIWKDRLGEEIERRDRFFLFWSQAASRSEYVAEEYHAALRFGKPITPVPLCSPEEVSPPRELAHLHFNDYYLEFLRYTQLPPGPRAEPAV